MGNCQSQPPATPRLLTPCDGELVLWFSVSPKLHWVVVQDHSVIFAVTENHLCNDLSTFL